MPNPTNEEQLILELVNRLRADPSGEALRLSGAGAQSNVLSAINYFGVNVSAFAQQMAAYGAQAPLAWNNDLSEAALYHNQQMITSNEQSHQVQGEANLGQRATNFGYNWQTLGENVFAYSEDMVHAHAGFVIDWGYDTEDYNASSVLLSDWKSRGDGMQDPAGHRQNLLSPNFTEIGIGVTAESNFATKVGPYVITQDLGRSQQYQAQFVGVVIDDLDGDEFYDIGEGLAGIAITLTGASGTYSTSTWASGGWQIAAPSGTYRITFTGNALDAPVSRIVTLSTSNVKVDIEVADEHAKHDYNGDGLSDLLWRRSDGLLTDWLSTGTGFSANNSFAASVSNEWKVTGDGDFNGDGRVDLLWRNNNGGLTDWKAIGTGFTPSAFYLVVGNEYQVAGTGDFNGDGRDDILWRRSDGFVTNWASEASSFNGATGLQLIVCNEYRIAGTGDFNGDGLDDILWQRNDGFITDWLSTGSNFNGSGGASVTPGSGWAVEDVGDFNSDGLDDLLLRHSDGRVSAWTSSGNAFANTFNSHQSSHYQIKGVADVDGDGRDDIIWRSTEGALTYWLANETGFNGAGNPVFSVPIEWDVLI
jgi:uncharacterized protein YkwD